MKPGHGTTLVDGTDVVVIGYGPVLLTAAVQAADILARERNIRVKVINLPWLNQVDSDWLRSALGDCKKLFTLDDHLVVGGQGDAITQAITTFRENDVKVTRLGIEDFPPCGTNYEVLDAVRLDTAHLVRRLLED